MAHQTEALELMKGQKYFALFLEQGLGKSKITIDDFSRLFVDQEIDGVLIVAPKSAYLNWLTDEIPAHMPDWLPYRINYWDSDWTMKQRWKADEMLQPQDDLLDIFLVNIEALTLKRCEWFVDMFIRMHYCYCVIDESTCIKNHSAKRTKVITQIGRQCDYRRILTGTPVTKGPLDLYAQAEFLDKKLLGFTSYQAFKNYFAVTRRITLGSRSYEKIEKYVNLEELQQRVARFSFRRLKTECLDLPEKSFQNRYIEHTPEQERIYNDLKEEALVTFSDESMISSTSVLTTMMKLHQINCGHCVDDFGNMVHIPNNRLPALMEMLEDMDSKVIIWTHFQEDIRLIMAALEDQYGDGVAVHYYGETTNDQRMLHRERFNRDPSCRFFVSNQTGSKALTLVQSAYAIYYSYDYNLETWLQSQDRNHRIGQVNNVTYTSFIIPGTVDEKIMKSLKSKKDLADFVLDDWRSLLD